MVPNFDEEILTLSDFTFDRDILPSYNCQGNEGHKRKCKLPGLWIISRISVLVFTVAFKQIPVVFLIAYNY